MTKYQQYAEYKDSGIEWLGKIPNSWEVVPTKYLFNIVNGSTPKSGVDEYWDGDIIWVTPSDLSKISNFEISDSGRYITEKGFNSCGTSLVPAESIILSCRAPIGSLAITTKEICTNQGCKALILNNQLNNKFVFYYFSVSTEQLNILGKGTTFLELSTDELSNFAIPNPSFQESEKIANFLDYETAKIDSLIEKQKQLIQLLKEKRQAVISHAVTKGLNPNVSMKDSGVEWLGQVPEHWSVSRIGFHTSKIGSGKTPRGGAEVYQEEGILFLRSQNIYNEGLKVENSNSVFISDAIHEEMKGSQVQTGDVLLNITGGSIGRSCLVPEGFCEANVNQHVSIIRLPKSLQKFISFVMTSTLIQEQIDASQTGGNREGLNFEQISKLIFCLPPELERNEIVESIQVSLNKLNALEQKAQLAIQLMQERRTALISAAVTGKIDVRNWQNPTKAKMEFSA